ncbi:beta-galactosidase/beta-glucuronidase [Anopheles sinensis]|uniref:Beta-galactosidase/beta-glucuronidase n=1 Tax=Anopheles sinensis TaxID=74873 RepID=A0A084WUV3_ANOSI|nr:beta-galactosidase/beta-glucuronidase [Anopheles sinensis]
MYSHAAPKTPSGATFRAEGPRFASERLEITAPEARYRRSVGYFHQKFGTNNSEPFLNGRALHLIVGRTFATKHVDMETHVGCGTPETFSWGIQ